MNTTPRLSVVTIFRDEEAFLPEAIESVRAQSYEKWELLLVDDGSSDGSHELARSYEALDPERIRVLHHEQRACRGTGPSRDLGLRASRGEFVAFLDGDDVWLPERLARDVELLDSMPDVAMVYGPTQVWRSWRDPSRSGDVPARAHRDDLRRTGVELDAVHPAPSVLEVILTARGESPATCSATVRRRAAVDAGGFADGFEGLHEDQAFFAKILLRHAVYVRGEVLDRYRQHPASICHRSARAGTYDPLRPNLAQRRYLEWLVQHVRGEPGPTGRVPRILRRELWLYGHPRVQAIRTAYRLARDGINQLYGRLLGVGYDVARMVVPRRARHWLWDHGVRP